ncbi:hypothetical protein TWF594_001631 [Orbilia oligospora]|uniref:Restriction of telomere capping protein 4 n=1 Tax=Orbilia oligospora TaxID=2813651 RepID=A0A7C8JE86_ORBOL|nr:hypothetical protein TWF706_002468 [Orbilia oligospora]KAF3118572.1 hypothetical protein TWF703_004819 [Orbilia oligospora]KAF3125210.1 hypothetical protein TWF594_001631 [Orbilia oligospora]
MYSGRSTRLNNGQTNVNKPFKSPVTSNTPGKKQPDIFQGLLDDIEDSDEEDEEEEPNEVIDLISPEKAKASVLDHKPNDHILPGKEEADDDEIEEMEENEDKTRRRTATPGKKPKFTTRQKRETLQYRERRKTEREAAAAETKAGTLSIPPAAEALLRHTEKNDPAKLEMEIPKPTPQKSIRERYNGLLKSNGVNLQTRLISLLDDRFDKDEPNSGSGSDSDGSLSSTSSKKRKRRSSDSDSTPKKIEALGATKQKKKAKQGPKKYRCPMCKEEVSKQLYESYLPDLEKKYKIDLRRKFHKSHKLAKVHKKVSDLDIPEIDWDTLEGRCKEHFPYLSDIMARKTESHYRDLSEKFYTKKRNDHKGRTEALFDDGDWEKTYPGYYGPRGSEIIGDAISNSKLINTALKELSAKKDITTLRGGGAGAYIQRILIPEVGTRLIMEDFRMADDEIDKARELMQNTIDIGLLLNHGEEDGDLMGVDDGMEWWWKEREAQCLQEEETEPSQSQTSIYIETSDDEKL